MPPVNDVHSRLNRTDVRDVSEPTSISVACDAVREIGANGRVIAVAGGRHAMGGQQFATDATLPDTRAMSRSWHSIANADS